MACIADATLLIAAVTKSHNAVRPSRCTDSPFCMIPLSASFPSQSEMLAMWGVDALLADDVVARMSAAASGALSDSNSSVLVQWMQSMLDHVAPVPILWSLSFAATADCNTTINNSLSDLLTEVSCLLPSEKLDLNDSDHTGIFHALARAQQLLHTPPERSLVAPFDHATTRCFQELSRNMQTVVQRCVQTDDFSATASPSVKHSSSAVDVRHSPAHHSAPLSFNAI
jgi:hypothetical protein